MIGADYEVLGSFMLVTGDASELQIISSGPEGNPAPMVGQVLLRPSQFDTSVIQKGQFVRKPADVRQNVVGIEYGPLAVSHEFKENVQQLCAYNRIEPGRGFVEQQQPGERASAAINDRFTRLPPESSLALRSKGMLKRLDRFETHGSDHAG